MKRTRIYTFEDGYFCYIVGKMSKVDLLWTEKIHGKLISITPDLD